MYYPQGFRREGIWITDKLLGEVRKYMDNETILEIWLGKVLIKFAIISADLLMFKFVFYGTTFQSTFLKNLPSLEDGIYVGGAVNQVPHGKGTIEYFEHVKHLQNYTGEWRAGKKQGFGKMFWKDGDRYRGDWGDDLPEGKGEYFWSNGNKFVGQFQNGLPSGEGVFETKTGDIFVGNMINGLPTGKGEFVYGDGPKKWDKFVGEFKNGMFNGNGTYYSNDGSR